ncbi:rhomboid family intramembrane serine protease [Arthrobacter sp. 35W]|uniref:rhomboid family intramembrane serine protease n=1 Tax=Arthrobacter sp. 35W TaxID=1132441 RepID=UPI00041CD897|nr:rhomboid family intramembrane serine protease [Arthrobacter sp. 35W]
MSYSIPTDGAATDVPVCPRHPDRVAYVRCQRCGRPACPDCQRSAAVGIQCVDCVNEAARSVPVARTIFGGTVRAGRPIVTLTLIAICVGVFILEWLVPNDAMVQSLAYVPRYTEDEPWRMITSAFLHSQGFLLHIAFNMYALWILGNALEPALGRSRYLALYLLSAFAGSVGVLLLSPVNTYVVGASGAIFGLFGALFVVQRKMGGDVRQLLVLIAINAVLGFVVSGIAWQAHLGGLLAGALGAVALVYAPRGPRRNLIQWGGLALVALMLIGLTVYRVAAINAYYALGIQL